MKRILPLLFLALSICLCSCSFIDTSSRPEPIVLECLVMQPKEHAHGKALISLGKTLEKKTRGDYSLSFTYVDESITPEDILLAIQEMDADMALLPNATLSSCNFEFLLLEHPYFFETAQQQQAFLSDPEISTALYESITADFVRVLGEFYNGTNHLASAEPLTNASDLDSISIYASGTLGSMPLFEAFGAVIATPDAAVVAECNIFDYQNSNLSKRLPHLTLTGHSMPPYALIISEEIWGSFPDEVIQIFRGEMPKLTETAMKELVKAEETALSELSKSGRLHTDFDPSGFDAVLPSVFDLFQHTEISQDLCKAKENFEND